MCAGAIVKKDVRRVIFYGFLAFVCDMILRNYRHNAIDVARSYRNFTTVSCVFYCLITINDIYWHLLSITYNV